MKSFIMNIELKNSDPLIWRRIIMPAEATFNRLHDIIQGVTNFNSGYPNDAYHLFEFNLREENIRITNEKEAYSKHKLPSKSAKTVVRKPTGLKIDEYIEKYKVIEYNYDFGDGWQFIISL